MIFKFFPCSIRYLFGYCAILYNLTEQQQIIHWSVTWNWRTDPRFDVYMTCKETEIKQMAVLGWCEFELMPEKIYF